MESKDFFLKLVRLGLGVEDKKSFPKNIDWLYIQDLANKQGLSGVVLDGIEILPIEKKPDKRDLLQWIGEVLQSEQVYAVQEKAAAEMALLFHGNCIRTYVLKGAVVAECYPKPEHRASVDMDCYLQSNSLEFSVDSLKSVESSESVSGKIIPEDVWERGNKLIEEQGYEVKRDFYKNSTFYLPGLTVENHKYFTPFRGNKKLRSLEVMLQSMMKEDLDGSKGTSSSKGSRIGDTWLYRPPVMVTALFLIEHAYSHFLHEGLTWRHVLDWMMFCKKHKEEIDWFTLDAMIDEFGFRKFYDSYYKIGKYLLGEVPENDLTKKDNRMLDDVWNDLDLHESDHGLKGKLTLAGNTWRARWKYRFFSEISMIHALWIQTKGVLFIKNPKLD